MGTPMQIKCEKEFEISLSARICVYTGFFLANLYCLYALYKIRPKAKSNLLIILLILLIISNTASCLWQYSNQNYNIEKCTPNVTTTDPAYRTSVVGVAISGPLAVSLTTLIHWQFAYKYWELSYRVESRDNKSVDL